MHKNTKDFPIKVAKNSYVRKKYLSIAQAHILSCSQINNLSICRYRRLFSGQIAENIFLSLRSFLTKSCVWFIIWWKNIILYLVYSHTYLTPTGKYTSDIMRQQFLYHEKNADILRRRELNASHSRLYSWFFFWFVQKSKSVLTYTIKSGKLHYTFDRFMYVYAPNKSPTK